jgi:alkylhydroperoxidase family enzyme
MRPTTAGILVHRDTPRGERAEVGTGTWQPILAEPTWRAVVALLGDPSRRTHNGTSPRWLGSGVYLCGRCDNGTAMRAATQAQPRPMAIYRCRARAHVIIKVDETDAFVRQAVAELLRAGGADLLAVDRSRGLAAAGAELAAARAEHEALADSGVSVALAAKKEPGILARIDRALAEVTRLSAGSALAGVADAPDPGGAFLALGIERQRAVVQAIASVTIKPADQSGPRRFDYGRIVIEPIQQP